jgi:3-oxoacyl-[acyl-carrier protein] reductase
MGIFANGQDQKDENFWPMFQPQTLKSGNYSALTPTMRRLEKKVAIITGGARGIGRATAVLFARQGAQVVIWDIDQDSADKTAQQIQDEGLSAEGMAIDTVKLDDVQLGAMKVREKYGRIDILINNAGITRDATLLKMTPEQWRQVIDVNLTGVFQCTQAVAPYMVDQGYGRIISASSVVGLYGNFGQTNYVATKAGLIGMTKVWAKELGRKGITVNAIAPGFIATEMIGTIPDAVIQSVKERTPLGRFGSPEDIANAYLFLASDEAAFVNGAVLSVDGGISL